MGAGMNQKPESKADTSLNFWAFILFKSFENTTPVTSHHDSGRLFK